MNDKKCISISTGFNYDIPIEEQLRLIQKAGFTHVSLGCDYKHSGILEFEKTEKLKELLNQNHLQVDTIHGYDLDRPDAIIINETIVQVAKFLGAKTVVVHCSAFMFDEAELEKKRLEVIPKLKILEQLAQKYQIRFAFENVVPGIPTDFCVEMIEKANSAIIGFCYDSSHDQIDGPNPMTLLEKMYQKLYAVHISDRIREFVDHVLPDEGFIDFSGICSLIKKSEFQGPLLMEVEMTHSQYKNPEIFLEKAYEKATGLYDSMFLEKK